MKKRGCTFAAALGVFLLAAAPSSVYAAPTFPQEVSIGGQSLGGMTQDEADATVTNHVDALMNLPVTINVKDNSNTTTAGELGLSWSNRDVVEKTAKKYTTGNLASQFVARADAKKNPENLELSLATDPQKLETFVQESCKDTLTAPKDATIRRENGAFVITESEDGTSVDLEETKKALDTQLTGAFPGRDQNADAVVVDANVITQKARITTEDLATIQDVLGTYTTDFATSGAARSTNLKVGAEKINGTVLMPGEEFSGYVWLAPFTIANGYRSAAAYENGQVVDSIGGGVCQISTTLYNAVLGAELEVTQRQNHSMIVTYVPPSQDAAIAGTYKDLKFQNNYTTPLYIEGYTEGKKLTFTIYGKETRPANRKVEYLSETIGRTGPGAPKEIVDNSLAPGARVRTQSAHIGLKSRLWKIVTVDGAETERTLLYTDSYNASKAIYRVGSATAPAVAPGVQETAAQTQEATLEPETTSPTEADKPTGESGGPGVASPGEASR